MQKNIPDLDIILEVLKLAQAAQPGSTFINSLLQQYQERGSLSKKQLEGLHSKATKIKNISAGRLATLEAIILKKPNRYRSTVTKQEPVKPDLISDKMVNDILQKYPQHKRVLFFKMKLDKNDPLLPLEKTELEKFFKLLV